MSKKVFVYNIALKRDDGKIEQDTLFRDELFTKEVAEDICKRFSCSVLLNYAGTFTPASDSLSKQNSIFVELPKPEVVVDSDNNIHDYADKDKVIAQEENLQSNKLLKSELVNGK